MLGTSACPTGHVYHGHRAQSFCVDDIAELTEIRARQRTFDGAAFRTAIGTLSYAVIVLKLFDQRFYKIGLLYTVLSVVLFILASIRSRSSNHDFADIHRPVELTGPHGRIFGRPFATGGWSVVAVSTVVAIVEVILLGLVVTL
ncbi:hypothetical protein BU17DRAFT_57171 [Hysterangium stoloniferum]|nr:hypothetical protein BU17DRAFT_57171 [Hysterangium stoloniferum]